MLYRFIVELCRLTIQLFCRRRVEVRGAEHVPAFGPAVLVANHASYMDPPVIALALRRQIYFMAREEILAAPVLGAVLRRCGVFAVRQGTADRTAIRRAIELLSAGELVCVFPEGTRSKSGELQSPQPGAAMIAARAGAPLIPVALSGTYDAYPPHARWLRPARVSVTFGPPITPRASGADGGRSAELAGISRTIMTEIDRLLGEEQVVRAAA
jgi:1-acyl-sn-glycerol-3-phosphate acyltransferase